MSLLVILRPSESTKARVNLKHFQTTTLYLIRDRAKTRVLSALGESPIKLEIFVPSKDFRDFSV